MIHFPKPMRAVATATVLSAILLPLPWQPGVSAAEEEKATVYQIELIIFRNYPIGESERLLPLPPREFETGDAVADSTASEASIETSTELYGPEASFGARKADGSPLLQAREDAIALGDATEDRWPMVLPENFLLGTVLTNLGKAYGYRVLWHGSVMLPMVKQQDYHFTLGTTSFDDNRWSLQGQLQFRLSRFMHMNATLALTDHTGPHGAPLPPVEENEEPTGKLSVTNGAEESASDMPASYSGEIYGRYVLQQSRRMKSGQLHYIDHPAIGVLAMIQSVSEDAAVLSGPDNAGATTYETIEINNLDGEE